MNKFYSMLLFLFLAAAARAESPAPSATEPEFANCSWYRSKKKEVPVYSESDVAAKVIDRLSLGEKVCYIGEEKGFAILQWDRQLLLRGKKAPAKETLAYARLVDLWEPKDQPQKFDEQVQDTYKYRQVGGVPEDPLWFIRPVLNLFYSPDPCADKTKIGCSPPPQDSKR